MVATALFHLSSFNLHPVSPSLLYTSSPSLPPFTPPSTCTVSLVTWPLRRCSPAAGSDHQSVSWRSAAQRPLACKADSSNLRVESAKKMCQSSLSGRFFVMSPHAQSAGSLSFKAAGVLHRKKQKTKPWWISCLAVLTAETGHRLPTCKPYMHLVKTRRIIPFKGVNEPLKKFYQ